MDAKCNTHATSVSTSRKAGWLQLCKGVSLILIMFWSSLLGVCVFHAVLLPLLFFRQSHRLYRRMADALVYSWIIFNTVSAILRLLTMSEVQYLVLCIHARTSVLHVHWNCVYMYMSMYSHVCTYVCRNLLGTCRLVYFSVHGRMTHDVCGVTIHTRVGYCSLLLLWQALLELVYGVKVVVTGDCMLPGERSVIIMNHRTRLDWMFFWSVLVRQSGVCTEKIILKSTLKGIPGAGRQHTTCTPVCDWQSSFSNAVLSWCLCTFSRLGNAGWTVYVHQKEVGTRPADAKEVYWLLRCHRSQNSGRHNIYAKDLIPSIFQRSKINN